MFSDDVSEQIGYYVYRLVDPRNGETFYVGKGKGNRVFQHAVGARVEKEENSAISLKLDRSREIHEEGLSVDHFIHRHKLDEATALHVEAALIDAYPNLTNIVRGHYSDNCGVASSQELLLQYQAPLIDFQHKVLLLAVNKTSSMMNNYDAVRYAWRLSTERLKTIEYILAIKNNLVIDAFIAEKWLPATKAYFSGFEKEYPDRKGFIGRQAPEAIRTLYIGKRLGPDYSLSQAGTRYAPD